MSKKYKENDKCRQHATTVVVPIYSTRHLDERDEIGCFKWERYVSGYECPKCSKAEGASHNLHHQRYSGPDKDRLKGHRLYVKGKTAGWVRKVLKDCPGVKKIRVCDKGVEIIHSDNHCRVWGRLEAAGLQCNNYQGYFTTKEEWE